MCFLLLFQGLKGQNLVPNPGFELHSPCPTGLGELHNSFFWDSPPSAFGSTDYFHRCDSMGPVGVPANFLGHQGSASGNAYIGLWQFLADQPNYREYAHVSLNFPLVAGQAYRVSIAYSSADSVAFDGNRLGVYLGSLSSIPGVAVGPLSIEPQLEFALDQPANDTANWDTLSGVFIADGSEQEVVIGNFYPAAETGIWPRTGNFALDGAYLYLDNVVVETFNGLEILGKEMICGADSVVLSAIGGSNYQWAVDTNPSLIIANTSQLTVFPSTTRSYLLYAGSDTLEHTIRVYSQTPLNLGNDTSICKGDTLNLVGNNGFTHYIWEDESLSATRKLALPGTYWLAASDSNGCQVKDTFQLDYLPFESGLTDTTLCPGLPLSVLPNSFVAYTWDDGSTQANRLLTDSGSYWLWVEDSNGCMAGDTFKFAYLPVTAGWLPSEDEFCLEDTYLVDGGDFEQHSWSNGNANRHLEVEQAGTYFLEVVDSLGCIWQDSTHLETLDPIPSGQSLGPDIVICKFTQLNIGFFTPGASYLWNTGDTVSSIPASFSGRYTITVSLGDCQESSSVNIAKVDSLCPNYYCPIPAINVFTPNGDGYNDFFIPWDRDCHEVLVLEVFNRWGQQVYQYDNKLLGWDGTSSGKDVQEGTYFYVVQVKDRHLPPEKVLTLKGSVQVLR